MPPTQTTPAPITPQGIRDGDPAVLAALAARRGPAVLAFAGAVCEPTYVVRAAADAFARFRAIVAGPGADTSVHPDALLLRCARRAALDLARPGPDLGCGPAAELLAARAERTIDDRDTSLLDRHLASCDHCRDLSDRLVAADRAYRETDDEPLEPATLAPMVAALAASAPVVSVPVARPATAAEEAPEPLPAPPEEPEAEAAEAEEAEVVAEPEPEPEEPDDDVEPIADADVVDEPEAEPEPEREIPIGTKRLTGAPAPYYEVPQPSQRDRGAAARRAARGAAAAGGVAASLTKRAGRAARKRLDKQQAAAPPPPPPPAEEPEPEPVTASWARVESIEFPAVPAHDDVYDPTLPADDELEQTAARAAARHYRRLRHQRLEQRELPPDAGPPRLHRPIRDRGPHLPLSAHGPRDLALPAGLVVLAVLVIMAVAGVFGGGSETPATGTSASTPPEVSLVTQSATSISLEYAERIAERRAATSP